MIGVNVLVAFPYASATIVAKLADMRERGANVYIDSGAFSAWNAGKPIRLDEYIAFLRALPFEPTGYFQLDVVGDRAATIDNLRAMVDSGLKPIAVFQRGMPETDIDDLFGLADVVAVGGLGGSQDKAGFCKWFMGKVHGRKAHLLGHVSPPTIAATKPYSCDSTNWMFGTRGLQVMLYAGRGRRNGIHKGMWKAGKINADTWKTLESYGVTRAKMRTEDFWRRDMGVLGARSIIRFSTDAERTFGSHVYAACGSMNDLDWVEQAWQLEGTKRR
jgi:hypothetical protein